MLVQDELTFFQDAFSIFGADNYRTMALFSPDQAEIEPIHDAYEELLC